MRFSITDLSVELDLDRATVRSRLKGVSPVASGPKGSKLYRLKDVIKAFTAGAQAQVDLDISRETLRIKSAQAATAELELAKARGEFVSIQEVATGISREYSTIRSQFQAMHSRLALPLSRMSDPVDVAEAIQNAVNEVLTELCADAQYKLEADDKARRTQTVAPNQVEPGREAMVHVGEADSSS